MKKLLLVLLAVLLIVPATAETIDLSGMSYAELQALQAQVNAALWKHQEMEQVKVPAGVYKIGVDIPAGKWEIHANPEAWMLKVRYGTKLNSTGTGLLISGSDSVYLTGPESVFYDEGDQTFWTITLTNGYYLEFDETVYFRKPSKPSFRFD